ncbi:MAG: ABC transporter ATP-binding protein, partial [Lachnospiraceae bacterium]|nr:ABC transporter ATP-binding protein [Lachnospiraceae bacterium]
MHGISKAFGNKIANSQVELTLKKGEILSLLGENGSGKTTLVNMLAGIYAPDAGTILIDGKEVEIRSPEDAKRLGVGMVHQHSKLVEAFDAADNITIGTEKGALFLKKDRYKEIQEIADRFGFRIDLRKKVHNMSVSEKQTLEIMKVLYYGAKIIILDEPTAVLTVQEIAKLFDVLRRMREEGHSIIIITHKLNEVMEISDRVAILRKGEYITTVNTAETNEQELTEWMVGSKIDLNIAHPVSEKTEPLLEIRDLTVLSDEGYAAIDGLNFYIRGGEILGVAGIAGCGQRELCEAIAGLRPVQSGAIVHKGENIVGKTPKQILEKGIAMSFIPEDRLGMGLVPSMSIAENMILKTYKDTPGLFVDMKKGTQEAEEVIEKLGVVTQGTFEPVRRLSGGNVQKVLLGREIKGEPNVIVTAYPVRGLDINSSYQIYDILNQQKMKGVGI